MTEMIRMIKKQSLESADDATCKTHPSEIHSNARPWKVGAIIIIEFRDFNDTVGIFSSNSSSTNVIFTEIVPVRNARWLQSAV